MLQRTNRRRFPSLPAGRYASHCTMLVKKYGNRRLYDTEESRYITLEELADSLRRGAEVRVVDAKTNEDLTHATIAQILLEGRGAGRLLPLPLLVQLVRLGDDALAEFFGRYVTWALEVYLQVRSGAGALTQLAPFGGLAGGLASGLARIIPPFGGYGGMPAPMAAPPQPPPPAPAPAPAASPHADDFAALRRELDALKREVGGGRASATAKAATRAKKKR
jgi:polyhydroxyalkanoate synthesis repressor PhaR